MPQDDIFLQAWCCINSFRLGCIVLLSEGRQSVKFPPSHWSSRPGLKAPSMSARMSFSLAQPDALMLQFKALSFGLCSCLSAPVTGSALACILGCQPPWMASPPQSLTEQLWCSTKVSGVSQAAKQSRYLMGPPRNAGFLYILGHCTPEWAQKRNRGFFLLFPNSGVFIMLFVEHLLYTQMHMDTHIHIKPKTNKNQIKKIS